MPKFYAASTGGFYDPMVHAAMPPDAVAIDDVEHAALFAGQRDGRPIVAGPDGRPRNAAAPPVPLDERRAALAAATKREARRRILEIASLERQHNDNAAIATHAMALATGGETPAAAEIVQAAAARRAAIDAVRAASKALRTGIAGFGSRGLNSLDVTSPRYWPEG